MSHCAEMSHGDPNSQSHRALRALGCCKQGWSEFSGRSPDEERPGWLQRIPGWERCPSRGQESAAASRQIRSLHGHRTDRGRDGQGDGMDRGTGETGGRDGQRDGRDWGTGWTGGRDGQPGVWDRQGDGTDRDMGQTGVWTDRDMGQPATQDSLGYGIAWGMG